MNPPSSIPPDPGQNGLPENNDPLPDPQATGKDTPVTPRKPAPKSRAKRARAKRREPKHDEPQQSEAVQHIIEALNILQGKKRRKKFSRVEIRGRLGTPDQCEVRIDRYPLITLWRREHMVLLILAWFAKCFATASQAGRNGFPSFLRASVIADIIERLTAPDGPMPGRWSAPISGDVYRSIGNLRDLLKDQSSLIETGERPAGYRLAVQADKIILKDVGPQRKYWAALFDSLLR
jgi:hypothetical protein